MPPHPPPSLPRGLVLVHDFTGASLSVLPAGLTLAERTGAAVHLVHALPPEAAANPWRMQQAQARLAALRLHYQHVLLGRVPFHAAVLGPDAVAQDVGAYAREVGAGLIVTPTFAADVPGAPCPVLPGATLQLLLARPGGDTLGTVLNAVAPGSGDGALAPAARP